MPDRFQIGDYWLSQRKDSDNWQATYYDATKRQTIPTSLGTADFELAKKKLAEFVVTQGQLQDENPSAVLLSTLFARYYKDHGKNIASADVTKRALNSWLDFYDAATVAELTVSRQQDFLAHLKTKGHSNNYIRRIINAGKAALHHAYKRQELASVPYIFTVKATETKKTGTPIKDVAKLFSACKPGDKDFMYLIIAFNTLARPEAVLDLGPNQVNLVDRHLDLLPPDREQNNKRRPIIPITNTLLPWLQWCDGETFVNYHGKKIANNRKAFEALRARAGVKITRRGIRDAMAIEMRRRNVSLWEVEGWLGHRLKSTSETYAQFSPDYLSDGRQAIDDFFNDLQKEVCYPLKMAVRQDAAKKG